MRKRMKFSQYIFAALIVAVSYTDASAAVEVPVADPRIRTVVYNENEVFTFVTRHDFQSNIEFAEEEYIETISIGDAIGWQVTPAGRRIFVKPLQRNGITNLTVITNKRPYQFELVATDSSSKNSNHAYVLKFFYPDAEEAYSLSTEDRTRSDLRPVSSTIIPDLPTSLHTPPIDHPAVVLPGEIPLNPIGDFAAAPPTVDMGLNFNYTLTGPDSLAPTKVYDDGRSTFFEINNFSPDIKFSTVLPDGSEIPVTARRQENLAIIDQIGQKMTIRRGTDLICIFNENMLSTGVMVR